MLSRITDQVTFCRAQAAECRRKAALRADNMQLEYLAMAAQWERLAASFELAERVSGHIEWSSQRVPAYPPAED